MKKNYRIAGMFTKDEDTKIRKRVDKSGLSINQYVRFILLNVRMDLLITKD